jgi:hypothetical protein
MNMVASRRNQWNYAIARMHQDVYELHSDCPTNPWFARESHALNVLKRLHNGISREMRANEEPGLENADFRVWMTDSLKADFQEMWNAMRKLAGWIGTLVRGDQQNVRSIDGFVGLVCNMLHELHQTFPNVQNDSDIPADECPRPWMSSEWMKEAEDRLGSRKRSYRQLSLQTRYDSRHTNRTHDEKRVILLLICGKDRLSLNPSKNATTSSLVSFQSLFV